MADFTKGDYQYYITSNTNVRAEAINKNQTSYADIPPYVYYNNVVYKVTSLGECFKGCTGLINAPRIPDSVSNMMQAFSGCTSLVSIPNLPFGVKHLSECFANCYSLKSVPAIYMGEITPSLFATGNPFRRCFLNCESLTGDIYIGAIIPSRFLQQAVSEMFSGTVKPIVLHTLQETDSTQLLRAMRNTSSASNVHIHWVPEDEILFNSFTTMNYKGSKWSDEIYPETDARLVQVRYGEQDPLIGNLENVLLDLTQKTEEVMG